MPTLQLHQLRVAAVAKTICDYLKTTVDEKSVILACLFHDMGNIIKSDLPRFPEFLEPQGMDYWQKVKNEYIEKYGPQEHVATEMIAQEIGLPESAFTLLSKIGFSNLGSTDTEGAIENKICSYADMRVGPYGVLSIEERLAEARKRYEGRRHTVVTDLFEPLSNALRNIERELFKNLDIKPEDITDEKIKKTMEELKALTF